MNEYRIQNQLITHLKIKQMVCLILGRIRSNTGQLAAALSSLRNAEKEKKIVHVLNNKSSSFPCVCTVRQNSAAFRQNKQSTETRTCVSVVCGMIHSSQARMAAELVICCALNTKSGLFVDQKRNKKLNSWNFYVGKTHGGLCLDKIWEFCIHLKIVTFIWLDGLD